MKKSLKLVRSANKCVKTQIANLRSLKLKKIGDSVIVESTPSTLGRIKKVKHLIMVEDL